MRGHILAAAVTAAAATLTALVPAGAVPAGAAIRGAREAPGAQLWVARYNGPANKQDGAASMAVSPDGSRVFVTGGSDGGPTTGWDYATAAYSAATGEQLWVRRYNGPGNGVDVALSVAVSPDGSRVFVTGDSYSGTTLDDYATVAYGAATGRRLWVRCYDGPANGLDDASSLAVSPRGTKVFVTGTSADPGGASVADD
jgi:WD40 repeat protein